MGLLCFAVLSCAVLCCAVLCCAVLCCAVLLLCCAVLCCVRAEERVSRPPQLISLGMSPLAYSTPALVVFATFRPILFFLNLLVLSLLSLSN